jgi:hypothetical protein
MEVSVIPSPGAKVIARRSRRAGKGVYALSGHDWALLARAMRCAQTCDDLLSLVEAEGWLVNSAAGPTPHPAVAELRRQQLRLTRLLAALSNPLVGETAVYATSEDAVIRLP